MTIFALSSGAGRCGIAVVRISGPAAGRCLETITGRDRPAPRRAVLRVIRDPIDRRTLDRGLVVWFPAPASFTGEDSVELHLHGGTAVVAAVLDCLSRCPGVRSAEPGEFTRRAFDHGRLDLAEVEGLADLINAETEAQRRQALKQYSGDLSRLIEAWRDRLVSILAHCEALIDFPDEELPDSVADSIQSDILGLEVEISQYLVGQGIGERLRDGLKVTLAGAPNVGKSSLLNHLAARDAAIVSDVAGTTRDAIEVQLDLGGYPVTLIDTAGLRDFSGAGEAEISGQEAIEAEGVRRTKLRAAASDLKLVIFDCSDAGPFYAESLALVDDDALVVINKIDLTERPLDYDAVAGRTCFRVSAKTGEGIEALVRGMTTEVVARFDQSASPPALTRIRHRVALEDCREALARGSALEPDELLAEDLRLAARALGRITGRVDVEDLLDVVFRDFCIGK